METENDLKLAREAGRIDDGDQVMLDEPSGVAGSTRRRTEPVLERSQRAEPPAELDESRP